MEGGNLARCARELLRMFSIDAAFDGMTTVHNGPVQHIFHALAGGKQNLTLDQIDIRNHLWDRVLDLNAGIHFDEVKPSILIHEELDSAGVNVADIRQSLTENSPDIFSQFRRHLGGGRLLEQLLMPPLNRAFALAQAYHIAVLIGQNLEFNVARAFDKLLHIKIAVAKCCSRLGLRSFEKCGKLFFIADNAHAAPAAAGRSLNDHWKSNLPRPFQGLAFARENAL